ncbi:unnamed protein product [Penicillium bialowiezense]
MEKGTGVQTDGERMEHGLGSIDDMIERPYMGTDRRHRHRRILENLYEIPFFRETIRADEPRVMELINRAQQAMLSGLPALSRLASESVTNPNTLQRVTTELIVNTQ